MAIATADMKHGLKVTIAGSDAVWDVASGTDLALFRHRLILTDPIFTSGFEASP